MSFHEQLLEFVMELEKEHRELSHFSLAEALHLALVNQVQLSKLHTNAEVTGIMDGWLSNPERSSEQSYPSVLMYLINESHDDDWIPVVRRAATHPHEVAITSEDSGTTALHAACLRYPPVHVVQALVEANPDVALLRNSAGETPLHLASYSASEEVQLCLLKAAPEAASLRDQYGDCPLHFAARDGATLSLLEQLVHACPQAISFTNNRGVTPFWLLPRSFLQAESVNEILTSEEDDEEVDDYRLDWDAMVLFLRYSYYGEKVASEMVSRGEGSSKHASDYEWVVHAAACTPSCPREVLKFLCRVFPDCALRLDHQGLTPLQLAVKSPVLAEPTNWNEDEGTSEEPAESLACTPTSQVVDEESAELLRQAPASGIDKGEEEMFDSIVRHGNRCDEDESVLDILLEWCPSAINVRDASGRKPLTAAMVAGQDWETIRRLIAARPQVMQEMDPVTRLSHVQLAAAYSTDLTTVFAFVRSLPEKVVWSTSSKRSADAGESTLPRKRCRLG